MRRTATRVLGLAAALSLVASCGEGDAESEAPPLPLQGALIDGSEDATAREPGPRTAGGDSASSGSIPVDSDGVLQITFRHLSLVEYDVDAMLEALHYPEEYTEEERQALAFPPAVTRFDGVSVSLVGYMIPGEIEDGRVRDFMLVRDLASCCFGGSPMPDEWVDVLVQDGVDARYHPYVPMRVTGRMTLGGELDEAGFAVGIYRLVAEDVELES